MRSHAAWVLFAASAICAVAAAYIKGGPVGALIAASAFFGAAALFSFKPL